MKYPPQQSSDSASGTTPFLNAFQRLQKRLQRMAARMIGDETEAEDALQDAFVKLWIKRDNIHSEDEAAALLTTTVKNLSIDTIRHRQTTEIVSIDDNREASTESDADKQADINEKFDQVRRLILQQLTPLQQTVLRMRDYESKDYQDIADLLHMQLPAVRMQLSRARKIIREAYRAREHYI